MIPIIGSRPSRPQASEALLWYGDFSLPEFIFPVFTVVIECGKQMKRRTRWREKINLLIIHACLAPKDRGLLIHDMAWIAWEGIKSNYDSLLGIAQDYN